MKSIIKLTLICVMLFIILISCKDEPEPNFTVETVTKTLNNQDVYFIFTNTSMTSEAPVAPSVQSSVSSERALFDHLPNYDGNDSVHGDGESGILKEISDFYNSDFKSVKNTSRSIEAPDSPMLQSLPSDDALNNTETFYLGTSSSGSSVTATCQYVGSDSTNSMQLSIWVDTDDWGSTINSTMVNALADEFLFEGIDNDIYDWVSDIYGVPWGTHMFSNLLNQSQSAYITILLYDIDGDNSTNGGTVGFFYPKDNFLSSHYSGSNERIMFYIDSRLYATEDKDGNGDPIDGWQATDFWPKEVFSTLAHEFQHMVHFYQKQIKLNADYSDTWLDEMCSLVTEDLVADKIGIPGPRGIEGDYTAGSPRIINSRLSDYNYANMESFLVWDSGSDKVYNDYAAAYAFGAYLARNYGGAALFQDIVQSVQTDETAVVNAINNLNGTNKTFSQLLIEWGIAVLNSDLTSTQYKYNVGGEFESSPDNPSGTDYALGSINLHNYSTYIPAWNDYLDGPVIYNGNVGNPISEAVLEPSSNTFYQAGTNLSGTHTWTVEVPKDVELTVVVK